MIMQKKMYWNVILCAILLAGFTGDCSAAVNNSLNVTLSGVGSVSYYGNPQVSQNISGLGSVNSKGEHN